MKALLPLVLLPAWLGAQTDAGRVLPADQSLHLAAFGDFGSGGAHQAAVAKALARRNAEEPFNLGITLGDNFYPCGVRDIKDPKWKTRWEDLYTPLGIPFYATLGNHDYGHPKIACPTGQGSPDVEVAYTKRGKSWRMPARYYSFKAGTVLFVAIDTEGWSDEQLKWIEATLKASADDPAIKWRIVYGHHPAYTSGEHLNERRISVLRAQLVPVMKAAHVDLYICGHDHDLEHLRTEGIEFLICGGGGAKLRQFRLTQPESLFTDVANAFLDIKIDEHQLTAKYLDTDLKTLETPPLILTK
ncbi:MAG TPA: metallophosphoesterase [Bryobacteraceae bacterium]|nr:metallophosphoesterase [Bryobacteraceae bacterium]